MGREQNANMIEALLAYRAPYEKPAKISAEDAGIFNNSSHVGEPIQLRGHDDEEDEDSDDDEEDDSDDWFDEDTPF